MYTVHVYQLECSLHVITVCIYTSIHVNSFTMKPTEVGPDKYHLQYIILHITNCLPIHRSRHDESFISTSFSCVVKEISVVGIRILPASDHTSLASRHYQLQDVGVSAVTLPAIYTVCQSLRGRRAYSSLYTCTCLTERLLCAILCI